MFFTLECHGVRIDVLHLTVLAKNERLIITTMLLDNLSMSYF